MSPKRKGQIIKVVTEGIRGKKRRVAIIWVSSDGIFSFPSTVPLLSRVFCSFSGMHFMSERYSQTCFPIHHSSVCTVPDPGNSLSNLNALQRQRVSNIGAGRGGDSCPSNLIANSRAVDNFYGPRRPFQANPQTHQPHIADGYPFNSLNVPRDTL